MWLTACRWRPEPVIENDRIDMTTAPSDNSEGLDQDQVVIQPASIARGVPTGRRRGPSR